MAVDRQNADGSVSVLREQDSLDVTRNGGRIGPAGSNTPAYFSGSSLVFNVAGPTDSAGGLLAWQNLLGYDIMVTSHQVDVTTITGNTCTASFGGTTSSTASASNMISGGNMHSTAVINGGALSVKVTQSNWITGSVGGGTSSGLIARAYFQFYPVPTAGNT